MYTVIVKLNISYLRYFSSLVNSNVNIYFQVAKFIPEKKRKMMDKLFTAKLLIQFWKNISKELYTNYVDIIIYIRRA